MQVFYTTEKIDSPSFVARAFARRYPERDLPLFCKTKSGKPYFENTDDIFFSITHDGAVTAVKGLVKIVNIHGSGFLCDFSGDVFGGQGEYQEPCAVFLNLIFNIGSILGVLIA